MVEKILQQDSFYIADVANDEITEFVTTMTMTIGDWKYLKNFYELERINIRAH